MNRSATPASECAGGDRRRDEGAHPAGVRSGGPRRAASCGPGPPASRRSRLPSQNASTDISVRHAGVPRPRPLGLLPRTARLRAWRGWPQPPRHGSLRPPLPCPPASPLALMTGTDGKLLEICQGRSSGLAEGGRRAGRYRQRFEVRLAVGLGGFQPGAGRAGSEGRNADRLERIGQTCGQRSLGAHRHQIGRLALGPAATRPATSSAPTATFSQRSSWPVPALPGATRIRSTRAERAEGTADRMLAAATAHHEHRSHELTLPTRRRTDP